MGLRSPETPQVWSSNLWGGGGGGAGGASNPGSDAEVQLLTNQRVHLLNQTWQWQGATLNAGDGKPGAGGL